MAISDDLRKAHSEIGNHLDKIDQLDLDLTRRYEAVVEGEKKLEGLDAALQELERRAGIVETRENALDVREAALDEKEKKLDAVKAALTKQK